MNVSVIDLGRRPYQEVWAMQKELVQERSSGHAPDTLLLVEHDHVVTLGRKTSQDNLERVLDIPVFQVERGGTRPITAPANW